MILRRRTLESVLRTGTAIVGDCSVAAVSVWLVVTVRRSIDIPLTRSLLPPEKFPLTAVHLALWSFSLALALALSGFYETTASPRHRPTLFVALPLQLTFVAISGTLLEIPWPRTVFLAVPILETVALLSWRGALNSIWPPRVERAVVVGAPSELLDLMDELGRDAGGLLQIDGLVSVGGPVDHPTFLGTIDDPAARKAIISAAEVIDLGGDDGLRRLSLLSMRGHRGFLFVPHVRDAVLALSHFGLVGDRLLAEVRMPGAYGAGAMFKRAFDIVVGTVLFLVTLPLQLLVVLAVMAERRGSVLIRQPRLGVNGTIFPMWKFRTMEPDPNDDRSRAVDDDRRVTTVGRWLRRYRLDELPQLVNVIAGDMSIVGPRPEMPEIAREIAEGLPFFELRLAMRPGLAGLAQVSGEYDQSAETKLTYDLQYLCSWSPLLDIRILVRTITVVLAGRGV